MVDSSDDNDISCNELDICNDGIRTDRAGQDEQDVVDERNLSHVHEESDDDIVESNDISKDVITTRKVICADACIWLQEHIDRGLYLPGSVFTSLPDITEINYLFAGCTAEQRVVRYEEWFHNAAQMIFKALPTKSYAIFLQSDIRVQMGVSGGDVCKWIDKSHLLSSAADKCNCTLLWHKITHTGVIDARSAGRPVYSHLICYAKNTSYNSGQFSTPDIFPRGYMIWPKGIGFDTCLMGVAFLKSVAIAETVVDPFCGYGTVLAMSNALGLSAVGVDISQKRCKRARKLDIRSYFLDRTIITMGKASVLGLSRIHQKQLRLFHPNLSENEEIYKRHNNRIKRDRNVEDKTKVIEANYFKKERLILDGHFWVLAIIIVAFSVIPIWKLFIYELTK